MLLYLSCGSDFKSNMNIFQTYPVKNLHAWTITSRLGQALDEAEKRYGPRDPSFTILGVEVNSRAQPQIRFRGNDKHVIVQITKGCSHDLQCAGYEMAHEVIHCLNPIKNGEATVLEEGLATHFAVEYAINKLDDKNREVSNPKYAYAMNLVRELLQAYGDDVIKRLRNAEPSLSAITPQLIYDTCPDISKELVDQLTQKFKDFTLAE